ncbi:MAG: prepilin peptidase [Eubacterium sp.]|nr:prepilin peptidase [Eubacterium sp.]
MWIEIFLFLLLGICAVIDGIKREIPIVVVWLGIAAAVILRLQGTIGEGSWRLAVLSVIPGVIFWMLSLVTGEKVGYGDGWLLVMIGLFAGLWKCFLILLIGLLAESVAMLVLLAVRRISRDHRVPFAPFLLLGMGVAICL